MDPRVRNRLLGSDLDETLQHSEGAKAFWTRIGTSGPGVRDWRP